MPNKIHMSVEEFLSCITDLRGVTPISFCAKTDARLRKTGNPLNLPVFKKSVVNGMVGYNYENSVNRQRLREDGVPDFEAESRKWGVRIHPSIVEHKGKYYLTVKVQKVLEDPTYFDANGNELPKASVAPFLAPISSNPRQELANEVIHREYSVDNLVDIRIDGKDIVLT